MKPRKREAITPVVKEENKPEVEFKHHQEYSTSVPYESSSCKNYTSPPVKTELSVNITNMNELKKQKQLNEKKLLQIENQIFQLESTYLENSWSYGNILKGFDSFLTNRNKISNSTNSQYKKAKRKDQDRIFTYSSFINYNELLQEEDQCIDDDEEMTAADQQQQDDMSQTSLPMHPSSLPMEQQE